jgi:hypothetical protein
MGDAPPHVLLSFCADPSGAAMQAEALSPLAQAQSERVEPAEAILRDLDQVLEML